MTTKPSEQAVSFEAVKVSMTQNKDGVMLKLAIHPNDCPSSLHTDWVGTRYTVALVKMNDDGTIAINKDAEARKSAVAIAGSLCRNERFQAWLVHMNIAEEASEDDAVKSLHAYLGISSRRELSGNDQARRKFLTMKASFELDVRMGRI